MVAALAGDLAAALPWSYSHCCRCGCCGCYCCCCCSSTCPLDCYKARQEILSNEELPLASKKGEKGNVDVGKHEEEQKNGNEIYSQFRSLWKEQPSSLQSLSVYLGIQALRN